MPSTTALDRRGIAVLSLGHVCADMCQGAVPALLPFLIAAHGWSYGAVSALMLAATVASSFVQPVFGHLSDRYPLPWLMPAGVLVGGLGVAAIGLMDSYAATFAVVVVSGLGVAAYHPEASRFANYVSGQRRATGMSLFSIGGNVGFALGPILVTPLVLVLGLPGTTLLMALPALVTLVLSWELRRLVRIGDERRTHHATAGGGVDRWGPFTRLGLVVAMRSSTYFGLMTFVPLYFVAHLHSSKAAGNTALSVMLVAGVVGTLVGGRLADRHGRRVVLLGSMTVLTPLIALFLVSGQLVATFALAVIGACTIATFSVTVVMGHEYVPNRLGVASGVMFGISIGFGGAVAALLGLLADQVGVRTVLELVAVLPLVALALTLTLPDSIPRRGARAAPAPATV